MENKALIITSIVGAIALIFAPVPKNNHYIKRKDQVTVKAENYLQDLKNKNTIAIDSINQVVDSLKNIKPKYRYLYKVIKVDTNGKAVHR